MKIFSLSLVPIALSLGTATANVRSRSQATTGKEKCPSAQLVSSSTFVVDGHEVTRQSFTCPVPGALAGNTSKKGRSITRGLFEKRSAAECRTPSPECQCGTNFVCSCFNFTEDAPNPNDCTILAQTLGVVSQAEGPTFLTQPDSFELVSFQTCAFEWQNADTVVHEYCWDELANTGNIVNEQCFEQPGNTAAECDADDDLWLSQFVRVSA